MTKIDLQKRKLLVIKYLQYHLDEINSDYLSMEIPIEARQENLKKYKEILECIWWVKGIGEKKINKGN